MKETLDHDTPSTNTIYDPELPEKWHLVFSLIDKAGGIKMPDFKELTPSERIKARMNFWALFFGPIYYLIKGMWKKTVVYMVLMVLFLLLLHYLAFVFFQIEDLDVPGVAMGIVWAALANVDYYKIKVLKQNTWI
jgi:Protein of unknown function (DUF2628)